MDNTSTYMTDEEIGQFLKNGYTEKDIQDCVNDYRYNKKMTDPQINQIMRNKLEEFKQLDEELNTSNEQTTLHGGVEKNIDLTPSGLMKKPYEDLAKVPIALQYHKDNDTWNGAWDYANDEYSKAREKVKQEHPIVNFLFDDVPSFAIDSIALMALPQAKVLQAGKLAGLANFAVDSASKNALMGALQSLKHKGFSKDLVNDTLQSTLWGLGGDATLWGAGKTIKSLINPIYTSLAGTARIPKDFIEQAIKPNSRALDMTEKQAQSELMNTTREVRNAFEDIKGKAGERVGNAVENLPSNKGVSGNELQDILDKIYYEKSLTGREDTNVAFKSAGKEYKEINDMLDKFKHNQDDTFISNIDNLINTSLSDTSSKASLNVGKPSPKLLTDARKNGLNVGGFNHEVNSDSIRHINTGHGEGERLRGQVDITSEDFKKIPDIISDYDSVIFDAPTRQGLQTIRYTKNFPDGTTYYLEEVRTGRKTLTTKTMYKMDNADVNFRQKSSATDSTSPRDLNRSALFNSTNDSITYNDEDFKVLGKELKEILDTVSYRTDWNNLSAKDKNQILERVYGAYSNKLNQLSPELNNANREYSNLMDFEKSEGIRRILNQRDDISNASSALRNYDNSVTKGNINKNVHDLENLLINNGYPAFLNTVDDINAVMSLSKLENTGDSLVANLTKNLLLKPSLYAIRGYNGMPISQPINNFMKDMVNPRVLQSLLRNAISRGASQ